MRLNVFECSFDTDFVPLNPLEDFFKLSRQEINESFFNMGRIKYLKDDTYYHLCYDTSYVFAERIRRRHLCCKLVSMKDVEINHILHSFVSIFDSEKLEYIVDFTFKQFMTVSFFIPERIYHFEEAYLSPAYFGDMEFFSSIMY